MISFRLRSDPKGSSRHSLPNLQRFKSMLKHFRPTYTFGEKTRGVGILLPESRKKLGSNLGQITAENRVKPWSVTQNQAKRINGIAFLLLFRDQGVGGSGDSFGPRLCMVGSIPVRDRTIYIVEHSLRLRRRATPYGTDEK